MKTRTLKILAVSLGLCAAAGNLAAQVMQTNLYSFATSHSGIDPEAALVQGNDGNFYGTTRAGGTIGPNSYGTVFRISPNGSVSNLYTFSGAYTGDGEYPVAGLVLGRDGNFYGTTEYGGTNNPSAYGTVFRISPSGSYSNLYWFGNIPDGNYPEAGLVQGRDGNFYGTTYNGGTGDLGTVFQITTNGNVTILHSFTNCPVDGAEPQAGLVQGSDGNFYGTTYAGGTNCDGTVFRITTNGNVTILHSFAFIPDGAEPEAGLVQGSDGNLYGTTYYGGTNSDYAGTVFRISPSGSGYSVLHSFGSTGDGAMPVAGLVQGSDGNFYGTTEYGGTNNDGTLFRISPSGSYSLLYSFRGIPDGIGPLAVLVQGSDGNFYGTTANGGTNNSEGTVFKLTIPLNPPANQISAIQVAGTNVLVTLPSVAAEMYQLQSRTSLAAGVWADVAGASAKSIGGPLTVTNFGGFPQSQQFYRFAITP